MRLFEHEYDVIRDDDCLDCELVKSLATDYFEPFDYLCGDYAYGKLRLKGFYDKKNPKATEINTIERLDDYINNYCSYGAKVFLLKKIK